MSPRIIQLGIVAVVLTVVTIANPTPAAHAAIEVEVITVPPLEGAKFELDGRPFEADGNGRARIDVDEEGTYQLRALDFLYEDGIQAKFQRWCCPVDSKIPEIELTVSESRHSVQVGYRLNYQVDADFLEIGGVPVELDQIERIRLRNDQGFRLELDDWSPQWVVGLETSRVRGGLAPKDSTYRLEEVLVKGSNVVNRGQQSFIPRLDREWDVELLFYSLEVSVSDYLYGVASGSNVLLIFPNGEERTYELDSTGRTVIESLPRGAYEISVQGNGIQLKQPVSLSRNQQVELQFVSYIDIATGVVLAVVVCALLLSIGRPGLALATLRWLRRSG